MVLNVRNMRVLAMLSLLLVATTGQKSYWSNFREVNDDGADNGDSESSGWEIAQRPSEQSRGTESQQEEEPQTWTQGPGEGEPEMSTENGWSNGQERYVVQQRQEDENQHRGQTSPDEEKVWVRSRGQSTPREEEKVWVSARGQQNQDEEKVWVNRPTRVQQQSPDEEEKVWVKRPTRIQQQGPDDEERVWVSNKPTNGREQQVREEKVWVRGQPNQNEANYEQERYYVQQQEDSSGSNSQEKPKEETPVYNDGPNAEKQRYIMSQQAQAQDEESERPAVTYVTRNQWAQSQQQQSEEEIPVKPKQQRSKEEVYAHQLRPTQQQIQVQQWQQQQRPQQEDSSDQQQHGGFVYKTKPSKAESSWRQPKSRPNSDSNVANPNNWPRARQMETYSASDDNVELQKKERILQLLQELQRLQMESLQDSIPSSSKRGSKAKGQQQQFAESVLHYWGEDQNQNQNEQGSESRPFLNRYGEDQVIPWSRLPRLTSKSDASPEIKKLAKVLAKEILNKQKETAGRHNHLHSRLNPADYYNKLKYGQARGNKQGGVTITWNDPWSNFRGQNAVRPSYDAAQSLYKSAGSAPAWATAQMNQMLSASRYDNTKKKANNPEVNVVEIAIPLVNGGSSSNDQLKRGAKGNYMLNSLTNHGQLNYGGISPAMGRTLIENSMAKLVEQYVKDTAAAVVAEAVKKDKSTKRLIPVLISLDKRQDKNETGTELINV